MKVADYIHFLGHCDKLPQAEWLKTTHLFSYSLWIKIKVRAGLAPSGGSGRESMSWPFLAPGGRPRSQACGPFLHLQSQ